MATDYREQILVSYLMNYLPVVVGQENDYTIYKTTLEIQDELSEMAEISINHIGEIMNRLGYHVVLREDNRPAWSMEENR